MELHSGAATERSEENTDYDKDIKRFIGYQNRFYILYEISVGYRSLLMGPMINA